MARVLITSGPTRQYLDPVRYLTNASSGKMGRALAEAATQCGHEVVIVSGPVDVSYPSTSVVYKVISTEEMLEIARREFQACDGLIGVAAPCDYRPLQVADHKLSKDGSPRLLQLVETPDVVATLGAQKGNRWVVGFALETEDHRFRAIRKLEQKSCDLIVLNDPTAMDSDSNSVEVLDGDGRVLLSKHGLKEAVAQALFSLINDELVPPDWRPLTGDP